MSFKEELDAAINSYDEVTEQRKAATGDDKVALDAKLAELADEVRSASKRAEEERAVEEARSKSPLFVPRAHTEERGKSDVDELRNALRISGANRTFEIRAVLGSAAKNYADKSFGDKVLSVVNDYATLTKAGATINTSPNGNPIAAISVDPVVALTARGSALPDTTAEANKDLSAFLYGGIVRVDNSAIEDNASDLTGLIATRAATALHGVVPTLNTDLLTGNGSSKPRGVLLDAAVGSTAGASAITAADLYKLSAKVQSATAWVMNSATYAAIFSLNVNGLWTIDPQSGINGLLGRKIVIDENMPSIGTGNKSVVLGDFANGYHLRVVRGIETQTLVERYAEYNQTGVKVVLRADGVVTDSNLVQVIQHA